MIMDCYGREDLVIYSPVETAKFRPASKTENFYLTVSRLNGYKRIDLAVKAFNNLTLKIAGDGLLKISLRPCQGPVSNLWES